MSLAPVFDFTLAGHPYLSDEFLIGTRDPAGSGPTAAGAVAVADRRLDARGCVEQWLALCGESYPTSEGAPPPSGKE